MPDSVRSREPIEDDRDIAPPSGEGHLESAGSVGSRRVPLAPVKVVEPGVLVAQLALDPDSTCENRIQQEPADLLDERELRTHGSEPV